MWVDGCDSLVRVTLGSAKIMHGETKTFSATLSEAGTITGLKPAPGTSESCLGTLGGLCAAYGRQTVAWNVFNGQVIKKTQLPFMVTVTISFEAWKGEYYGDQYGQPAPDMGVWFYPEFTFTPEAPPPPVKYNLAISTTAGGTTNPAPGSYTYDEGATVTVKATPETGYRFGNWEVNGGISAVRTPEITLTMDRDYTLVAVFSEAPPLKLTISATTGGTTTPTPGAYEYKLGTVATVSANPSDGYRFLKWQLDETDAGTNLSINITMDRDHALTAFFEAIPSYTLTILTTAGGTTEPSPGSHTYLTGTVVTATARPETNYRLSRWELDGTDAGATQSINVTMDRNHSLKAVFELTTIPPPGKGTLEVHAYEDSKEVEAVTEITGVENKYKTPFTLDLDPGSYTVKCTYKEQTKTETAIIESGKKTLMEFKFVAVKKPKIIGPFKLWTFPLLNAILGYEA